MVASSFYHALYVLLRVSTASERAQLPVATTIRTGLQLPDTGSSSPLLMRAAHRRLSHFHAFAPNSWLRPPCDSGMLMFRIQVAFGSRHFSFFFFFLFVHATASKGHSFHR
ncbi:hypothetical protein BC939DRAFT_461157 [Gamsiella multidivaricata]|uniref:uncharacterized protein n=1 Tax=Gamsiella multidivaricata TaxID=101098 RepID=UPI002220166C|nr:uncharacterized protein BC939DRAFT_461157 [Gamsiella multidivaricata]KAI7819107.1 hypothetical protein BC939DRAFT_461157 [Gamsiella multidivaricata]